MSAQDNGGPAFPSPGRLEQNPFSHFPQAVIHGDSKGMSLRDYFAAKAMHQFLHGAVIPVGYDPTKDFASLSALAYAMADAMLKARRS